MSSRRARYGSAALSGALLALAFPPFALRFLAWVALVPWFVVLLRDRAEGHRRPACIFGFVFFGVGVSWLWQVFFLFPILLAAYLLLYPLLLVVLLRAAAPLGRGVQAVLLPATWVALDLLREHLFTGFPWLYPGHALAGSENLVQAADLGGVPLLSFAVVLANAALALPPADAGPAGPGPALLGLLGRPGRPKLVLLGAALLLPVALSVYGGLRRGTLVEREGPAVLLVQPSFPQSLKAEAREKGPTGDVMINDGIALSIQGVREHPDVNLVVWAETTLPGPEASGEFFETDLRTGRENAETRAILRRVADPVGVGTVPDRWMLAGALWRPRDRLLRNSGLLLGPGTALGEVRLAGRFDKVHLIPFGEYLPLTWLLPDSTRRALEVRVYRALRFLPNLSPGEASPLDLPIPGGTVRLGGLVCYEVAFPGEARDRTASGVDVLVSLGNYAWYAGWMRAQVLDITRFRAVECRRPVILCCNDGPTCVIDGNGVVRASLEPGKRGTLHARVPLDGRGSLYARTGDLFALLAAAAAAGGAAAGRRRRRREGGGTTG